MFLVIIMFILFSDRFLFDLLHRTGRRSVDYYAIQSALSSGCDIETNGVS